MGEILRFRRLKLAAPKRITGWGTRRKKRRGLGWDAALAAVAVAALAYVTFIMPAGGLTAVLAKLPAQIGLAEFGYCTHRMQTSCVIDGDTFRYDGETIRIADIDTPEVRDYKCDAELALGQKATDRLVALMNAGAFELTGIGRDEDRYGRKLRIVSRDGQSLGMLLVAEGLAREWDGARHPWCA